MPIKVTCPKCQGVLHAPDDAGGKRGKCPTCGTVLAIPAEGIAAGPAQGMPVADRKSQVVLEPAAAHQAILVVPTERQRAVGVLAAIGDRGTRSEEFG